jgi:hypothetical protein
MKVRWMFDFKLNLEYIFARKKYKGNPFLHFVHNPFS